MQVRKVVQLDGSSGLFTDMRSNTGQDRTAVPLITAPIRAGVLSTIISVTNQ